MTCPTCLREFERFLPEIPTVSVYEFLARQMKFDGTPIPWQGPFLEGGKYGAPENPLGEGAVVNMFDPCASPRDPDMQVAARSLTYIFAKYFHKFHFEEGDSCKCCGFGGHPGIASPSYAAYCASERTKEGETDDEDKPYPYVTYCINCRDALRSAGSECYHVLELVFGSEDEDSYSVTERRLNRERVRNALTDDIIQRNHEALGMSEGMVRYVSARGIPVLFPREVWDKMDAQRMLASEVAEVTDYVTGSGPSAVDPESGAVVGCKRVGNMTYWVECIPKYDPDSFSDYMYGPTLLGMTVLNVWSHRMSIEREDVWNGEKRYGGEQ
jgi:hypothetical protein